MYYFSEMNNDTAMTPYALNNANTEQKKPKTEADELKENN